MNVTVKTNKAEKELKLKEKATVLDLKKEYAT
jgi:hypothetical protein